MRKVFKEVYKHYKNKYIDGKGKMELSERSMNTEPKLTEGEYHEKW